MAAIAAILDFPQCAQEELCVPTFKQFEKLAIYVNMSGPS